MKKKILVRYGDLMLKKKNIKFFIKKIRDHIENNLHELNCKIEFLHDRVLISYQEDQEDQVISKLKKIPGIFNFSIAYLAEPNIEDIIRVSILVLDQELKSNDIHFKIETKRIDKSFPNTSLEITQLVASPILKSIQKKVIVDVKKPEQTLYIDLRKEAAYIYIGSIKAMGGFPFGSAGKGLLMMSGGIDSPVAAYLLIKQGLDLEFIHFESTPLTPIESAQKVIDLTKIIAEYVPDQNIILHMVPFYKIHQKILETVFEPYTITIMRRMMYRISERFAIKHKMLALANGESICQVASQTLQSMKVIESVTKFPILRPLATYDKLEIIQLSEKIGTYETSIRPFNDCCSIYVPKSPVTRPIEPLAKKYENKFDYEPMLDQTIHEIQSIVIHSKSKLNLAKNGFTVIEALSNL